MATPTKTARKVKDLVSRIAQQEAALAQLRRQLDTRLADLNRRRETLQAQLRAVESEIDAVAARGASSPAPAAAPAQRPATSFPSLAEFLVQLVREANGKPVPLAVLKEQTVRRGFPSKSANLISMVEKRASELVKRGRLRRAAGKGYLLPQGGNAQRTAPAAEKPKGPAAGGKAGQPTLRSVLLGLLQKAGRSMSVTELAEQAQKAGYQSKSKDFRNVIWVALGNMPEAERDPRGGYRLK
jgi:hypothetical protein